MPGNPTEARRPALAVREVMVVALGLVALHATALARYGWFRDELYYVACAQHLAWGYVDQPPLSIAVLALVRALFGDAWLAVLRLARRWSRRAGRRARRAARAGAGRRPLRAGAGGARGRLAPLVLGARSLLLDERVRPRCSGRWRTLLAPARARSAELAAHGCARRDASGSGCSTSGACCGSARGIGAALLLTRHRRLLRHPGAVARGGARAGAVRAARRVAGRARLADARVHAQRARREDGRARARTLHARPGADAGPGRGAALARRADRGVRARPATLAPAGDRLPRDARRSCSRAERTRRVPRARPCSPLVRAGAVRVGTRGRSRVRAWRRRGGRGPLFPSCRSRCRFSRSSASSPTRPRSARAIDRGAAPHGRAAAALRRHVRLARAGGHGREACRPADARGARSARSSSSTTTARPARSNVRRGRPAARRLPAQQLVPVGHRRAGTGTWRSWSAATGARRRGSSIRSRSRGSPAIRSRCPTSGTADPDRARLPRDFAAAWKEGKHYQ